MTENHLTACLVCRVIRFSAIGTRRWPVSFTTSKNSHSFGMWRSNYLAATLHTRGRAPSHRNGATPVNSAAVTLVPRPVFPEPGVPRLIGCTCRNGGDKMEIAHAAMLTDALLVRMPRGGDARM